MHCCQHVQQEYRQDILHTLYFGKKTGHKQETRHLHEEDTVFPVLLRKIQHAPTQKSETNSWHCSQSLETRLMRFCMTMRSRFAARVFQICILIIAVL